MSNFAAQIFMWMQRKLIIILGFLVPLVTMAAEKDTLIEKGSNSVSLRLTGFVKSAYWYDSRQVVSAREDYILLYPAPVITNLNGDDINEGASFNFSAIASRVGLVINGPKAFGARVTGLVEGDFTGVTNADINGFRLRHAFGKLDWESSELLMGQFWHPMFATDVFPGVISLNTGAPFQPFIRNPQVTFKQHFSKFNLQLSLVGQRDNSSPGPDGFTPNYIRNAAIPNIHAQLQHKDGNTVFGLAADFKRIKPRKVTTAGLLTNENLDGWSFMGYGKYFNQCFSISAKAIYGQNLTEHLLLGGYAVRRQVGQPAFETYTPTNHLFIWNDLVFGRKTQFGLFSGFAKNFGTSHQTNGTFYGRGHEIDYLYRISPRVIFNSGKSRFALELEHTSAAFGTPDDFGRFNESKEISNTRLLFSYFLFF